MTHDLSLHHRRRPPTREELAGIPWLALLQPEERERAVAALSVALSVIVNAVLELISISAESVSVYVEPLSPVRVNFDASISAPPPLACRFVAVTASVPAAAS